MFSKTQIYKSTRDIGVQNQSESSPKKFKVFFCVKMPWCVAVNYK